MESIGGGGNQLNTINANPTISRKNNGSKIGTGALKKVTPSGGQGPNPLTNMNRIPSNHGNHRNIREQNNNSLNQKIGGGQASDGGKLPGSTALSPNKGISNQGKLNIQNVRNMNNNSNTSTKENSLPPKRPIALGGSDNNLD